MKRLPAAVAAVAALALVGSAWVVQVQPASPPSPSAPKPEEFLANGLFSLALLALGLATVCAVFLRGRDRAYWGGFAGFGLAYLMLLLAPWCETKIGPMLLTEVIFKEQAHTHGPQEPTQVSSVSLSEQMRYARREIGHSLVALFLGLVGGEFGWWFTRPAADGRTPAPPATKQEEASGST